MKARIFSLLMIASFVIFASCGDDKKGGGTSDFKDPTAANTAAQENGGNIKTTVSTCDNMASLAKSFTLINKGWGNYIYNSSTGWWTYIYGDTTTASGVTTISRFNYQLRFTVRDTAGGPTSATNQMEYSYDYYHSQTGTTPVVVTMTSDMNATGIAAYRAGTGPITINGGMVIEVESELGQGYTFNYDHSYDINNVTYVKTNTYATGGNIVFTIKRVLSPSVPNYPNYNVSGTITFNGTNIVDLTFGGYNFKLNLQTGAITPVT
jgi:hypothetical protein